MRPLLLCLLVIAGCDASPIGPALEPEARSWILPRGDNSHIVINGIAGPGETVYILPPNFTHEPYMTCMTSEPGSDSWGIVGMMPLSKGDCDWFVVGAEYRVFIRAPEGWRYRIFLTI